MTCAPLCSCSTDDSFSHYSLSVHGCRLSLFYWPDVAAARPVKFLWKLEQVLWDALMLCRPHFVRLLYSHLEIKWGSEGDWSRSASLPWVRVDGRSGRGLWLTPALPDRLKPDGLKDRELIQRRFVKSLRLNHNILLPPSFIPALSIIPPSLLFVPLVSANKCFSWVTWLNRFF